MRNVVTIGGGFGGLNVARALARASVRVTLIDRRNYHLFQPLLYQVATAGLSPADIAAPIRSVLGAQGNAEVLLAELTGVDRARKRVIVTPGGAHGPWLAGGVRSATIPRTEGSVVAAAASSASTGSMSVEIPYDDLVIATGSHHSYFGHEEWEKAAPGLKTLRDATRIRRRVLLAFERAETETDAERVRAALTFVVVGGGPTGVEMAGSIAELAHRALKTDFRRIRPEQTRILLVDAGSRVLSAFPASLSRKAENYLVKRGVELKLGARVEKIDAEGVVFSGQAVAAQTVIWAAGVVASPAGRWLGAETDRAGRVRVGSQLALPGDSLVFVIGDAACVEQDGQALPGVAPVAMQQGTYVGKLLAERSRGSFGAPADFRYWNKGNLATVGRSFAVADFGRVQLSGFAAWLAWLVVHIYYLIGFRTRLVVLIEWAWAYFTFERGARLITGADD